MIHHLIAVIGALGMAALSELHPLKAPPQPVAWGLIVLASSAFSTLIRPVRRRPSRGRPRSSPLPLLVFLGSYYMILGPLGWAHWVLFHLGWRGEHFACLLFLLLPSAALALGLSPSIYLAQRRAFLLAPPRGRFLGWLRESIRFVLTPAIFFLFIVWATGRLQALPFLSEKLAAYESLSIGLALPGLFLLFAAYPYIVRLAWRTRPFPAGPMADLLAGLSRRLTPGLCAIRIWEGTPFSLNACALGLIPSTRHIIFTSGMCDQLSPQEVAAVFSHEAGHLARGHMRLYLFFLLAFLFFLGPLLFLGDGLNEWLKGGLLLLFGGLYWGLLFRHLARWLEVEADLFGASVVGFPLFTETLRKVSALLGPSSDHIEWRHFSLRRRLEILNDAWTDGERRQKLLDKIGSLRAKVHLLFAAAAICFAWSMSAELRRPAEELAVKSAESAMAQADELDPLVFERRDDLVPVAGSLLGWLSRDRRSITQEYSAYLHRAKARLEEAMASSRPSGAADKDPPELLERVERKLSDLTELSIKMGS